MFCSAKVGGSSALDHVEMIVEDRSPFHPTPPPSPSTMSCDMHCQVENTQAMSPNDAMRVLLRWEEWGGRRMMDG